MVGIVLARVDVAKARAKGRADQLVARRPCRQPGADTDARHPPAVRQLDEGTHRGAADADARHRPRLGRRGPRQRTRGRRARGGHLASERLDDALQCPAGRALVSNRQGGSQPLGRALAFWKPRLCVRASGVMVADGVRHNLKRVASVVGLQFAVPACLAAGCVHEGRVFAALASRRPAAAVTRVVRALEHRDCLHCRRRSGLEEGRGAKGRPREEMESEERSGGGGESRHATGRGVTLASVSGRAE